MCGLEGAEFGGVAECRPTYVIREVKKKNRIQKDCQTDCTHGKQDVFLRTDATCLREKLSLLNHKCTQFVANTRLNPLITMK